MSKALGAIGIAIKEMIVYKYDIFIWTLITPVSLFVQYFLWSAIYSYTGQATVAGYSFNELINYFVLSNIVTILSFTNVDGRLADKIRTGDLVVDLSRPQEYFKAEFYELFGERVFFIIAYILPLLLLGIFVFNLRLTSWLWLGLATVSVFLAMLLFFTFVFFLGLAAFWLKEYHGVKAIRNGISWFFSGSIVPIAFFPASLQTIFAYLPFQYAVYTPIQIYFGKYSLVGALSQIGIQIFWIFVFYILMRIVWRRAMMHFTAPGG